MPLVQFLTISRYILLRMRNFSDKTCRENHNPHFMFSNFFFSKIVPFMRQCGKIMYSRKGHRWQYDKCTLHAGYLRLQTHTQNIYYSLLFHYNNGCTNMSQCYVIRAMSVYLLSNRWTVRAFNPSQAAGLSALYGCECPYGHHKF